MNASDRRALYKSETRAQILAAAREIFIHEGYESFSIRELAKRIEYSPAAIYKHFKSKREIFDCLAEESFAALMESSSSVKTIAGEPGRPLEARHVGLCELRVAKPGSLSVRISIATAGSCARAAGACHLCRAAGQNPELHRCGTVSQRRRRPDGAGALGRGSWNNVATDSEAGVPMGGSTETDFTRHRRRGGKPDGLSELAT